MIAYLDMPSGISGDMFLGCLVDAGWHLGALESTVQRLGLPAGSWQLQSETVQRGALRATRVRVRADEGDAHRRLPEITALIRAAELPPAVRERAIGVFRRLARAEATVHGIEADEVHFHEVGALDAIIDIVGVVVGLGELGIDALFASGVPLGEGWTSSAHGPLPLPAPATLALLAEAHAPTRTAPGPGELVTPTGAALLAELATFRQPLMELEGVGVGAGHKEFAWPNVARLWLGRLRAESGLVELQTNIDDMNPELYSAVSQRLFAAGARDVWMTPIHMKKSRPGVLLCVLAPATAEERLADLLLRETTTLGVRAYPVNRREARREMHHVSTRYGTVPVKVKWVHDIVAGAKPEYDVCVELAETHGVPARLIYEAALSAAHRTFFGDEGTSLSHPAQE